MIRIAYYTPDIVFASDLPDVNIFTDHDFVDFRMSINGYTLLEGRYYAINGTVIISDIASLVINYLAGISELPVSILLFEAYVGDDKTDYAECSRRILYCDRLTDISIPEQWLQENFLTLSRSRRIAPDSYINLSWYTTAKEGISVDIYCTFINDKGRRDTYQYVWSGNGLIAHVDDILTEIIHLSDIVARVKKSKKIESLTLQSVTVRRGQRSVTFFVDPALRGITPIYYLNCFGIVEHISLPRTTTEKIKSERSIASIGNVSQFYDISHSKEYEVETGGLSRDECLQVEQMLTSPSVRIPFGFNVSVYDVDFDALVPILITDYTSELSDGSDKLNSVKFTWRFAENRPKVATPQSPGIFDNHFNPVFT